MHTKVTYNYKHSRVALLHTAGEQAGPDDDDAGWGEHFKAPEGPLLLQFTMNDAPYKLSKETVYQLSTIHSCKSSTLVIDVGQGGDAHSSLGVVGDH